MPSVDARVQRLYRELGPVVYRRCLRLLGDRSLAEDATQEVFLKLLRDIDRLEGRESALPWLYQVTMHHCLNLRRAEARTARRLARLPVREEAQAASGLEWAELGQRVLERFDPVTQAVAVGHLVDGVEQQALAQALNVSAKTVSRKLQRFLVNARKFLARSEP